MASTTSKASTAPAWRLVAVAGVLGWVLDAFDFFVIVFLFDTLARHFHVSKASIVFTLTATLAMRPVGAILFGTLADTIGRKRPLMLCVLFFSTCTVLSGLAPSYSVFLVFRALYGIGMGGYWGVGASYAIESSPPRFRGLLSGIIQAGYPAGYLLAAVVMQTLARSLGWKTAFFAGIPAAVVTVILASLAPESRAWKERVHKSSASVFGSLYANRSMFAYLLLMMTVLIFLSHGSQDLYPDFLSSLRAVSSKSILGMDADLAIPVLFNLGAIAGALIFGALSQRAGRRAAVLLALAIAMVSIPAWAFGNSVAMLSFGSFFMQVGVQGAFGVVPAHLNELSPDTSRSLFTGSVYQTGVLLASPAPALQFMLRRFIGYRWALTAFEAGLIMLMMIIMWFGPEAKNRDLLNAAEKDA
jgi:SHS family lactate transporter-like MFS transporter